MSLRERTSPGLGIIEPCLPSPAKAPPRRAHDFFKVDSGEAGLSPRLNLHSGSGQTEKNPTATKKTARLACGGVLASPDKREDIHCHACRYRRASRAADHAARPSRKSAR